MLNKRWMETYPFFDICTTELYIKKIPFYHSLLLYSTSLWWWQPTNWSNNRYNFSLFTFNTKQKIIIKKNENQENQCWKLFRIPKEKTSTFFFLFFIKKERKMKRRNYNTTFSIHFFICCIESLPLKRTEQIVIIFSLYWIQANEFYWIVNSELYRICVPSI